MTGKQQAGVFTPTFTRNLYEGSLKALDQSIYSGEHAVEMFDRYPLFEVRRKCVRIIAEALKPDFDIGDISRGRNQNLIQRRIDRMPWVIEKIHLFMSQPLLHETDTEILRALFEAGILQHDKFQLLPKLLEYLRQQGSLRAENEPIANAKDLLKLLFKKVLAQDLYSDDVREFVRGEIERLEQNIWGAGSFIGPSFIPDLSALLLVRIYKFVIAAKDIELLETVEKYDSADFSEDTFRLSSRLDQGSPGEKFFELFAWRHCAVAVLRAKRNMRQEAESQMREAQEKIKSLS